MKNTRKVLLVVQTKSNRSVNGWQTMLPLQVCVLKQVLVLLKTEQIVSTLGL